MVSGGSSELGSLAGAFKETKEEHMARNRSKSERKYQLRDLKFGRYGFLWFTGAFFAL